MRACATMLIGVSLLLCQAAQAQQSVQQRTQQARPASCPEGRTMAGDCVNPAMTAAMRRSAIANTEPRISYTAPPWLPVYDRSLYVTRNYHEMNNLFLPPLIFRNTGVKP